MIDDDDLPGLHVSRGDERTVLENAPNLKSKIKKSKIYDSPSTSIILVSEADWRIALAGAYTDEDHQSFAFCLLGNSKTTIRPGCHGPSNVSAVPPRTTNFPSKGSNDAGVNFL